MNYKHLRKEYNEASLEKKDLNPNPTLQFQLWLAEAMEQGIIEPNAAVLATSTQKGTPSSRTILIKDCDEKGIVFFTNYESRKSQEIAENPLASLTLYWKELHLQIIAEGSVGKLTEKESAEYFHERPRGSKVAAWASKQDQPLSSREELQTRFKELDQKFGESIPFPPFWGGFRLSPTRFEFWKGRKNRLHDRFCYELKGNIWKITRLSP